jgi:hypothetical protein
MGTAHGLGIRAEQLRISKHKIGGLGCKPQPWVQGARERPAAGYGGAQPRIAVQQ